MSSISIRTIATLAIAVLLGLVAVFLTRSYLNHAVRPVPVVGANGGPTVPVVVASANIPRGGVLQAQLLKVVAYPAEAAPYGAFHAVTDLTGAQRLALHSMVANEPILPGNITGPGGKLNLSGILTAGMRAVSLRSNDVAGVGGFVLPGDRVDVLLTRQSDSGSKQNDTLTQVLAQNVRVLGIDQSDNDEADKPVVAKAVTVEVTPEQAQSIALGQQVGTVSLALRHVADDATVAEKPFSVSDLGPTPRRTAASGPSVRVVRGVEASKFSFSAGSAPVRTRASQSVSAAASKFSSSVSSALKSTAATVPAGVLAP
jgi:pilus assembly protein CpaB